MNSPKYKRVLLKVSGEALAGEQKRGLNFDILDAVAKGVKECVDMGVEIGIVVGGGNFWRGLKDGAEHMERTRADHMGMLATTINALALADVMEKNGLDVRVQTGIDMAKIAEPYIRLNPDDAKARGIAEGDIAEMYNDRGHAVARVHLDPAVRPGVATMPKGWQRDQFIAGGYQELTNTSSDPMACNFAYFDTLVEVRKYEGGN